MDSGVWGAIQRDITLREWAVLTEASVIASLLVLPYLLTLQQGALERGNAQRIAAGKRPITPAVLVVLTAAQSHVTFGVAAGLGLRAAHRMGLGVPRLETWLRGERPELRASWIARRALLGVAAALAIAGLDRTLFVSVQRQFKQAGMHTPAAWRGLLASAYGAVGEEVLMRLGLQTLLAAGLRRLRGETAIPPLPETMWPAIALSNVVFGAGHLPATKAIVPLTPLVVARALLLNGVAGTLCGYLYWQEGLEASMIAHGAADIVLHGAGALAPHRGNGGEL